MTFQRSWLGVLIVVALATAIGIGRPRGSLAQTAASLDNETMLSLVLLPLPDGSRPGVHLWARADQGRGPGGFPTVFVVTLYTRQGSGGSEEREVINYLQYSNGDWALARPRNEGTLLIDDWAWLSLNLNNLSAIASGQGDSSQYAVDYSSSGAYGATPRQLAVEEVYGADLSLLSSSVVGDSSGTGTATVTATPQATVRPPAGATAASGAVVTATAGAPGSTPAISPPSNPPRSSSTPASTGTATGSNTIRPGTPTP